MNLKQGTQLQGGRYRIEKVLGQGGFGITYLAEQTSLNDKVAIKEFFMFSTRQARCSGEPLTRLYISPRNGTSPSFLPPKPPTSRT